MVLGRSIYPWTHYIGKVSMISIVQRTYYKYVLWISKANDGQHCTATHLFFFLCPISKTNDALNHIYIYQ